MTKISSIISVIFVLCCSFFFAEAHFTLNSPVSRGFNDQTETESPCGGYNTTATVTTFYSGKNFFFFEIILTNLGQTISFTILDEHGTVTVYYAERNSSNFIEIPGVLFDVTASNGNGGTYTPALPITTIPAGSLITLQFVYESIFDSTDLPDAIFYQCADVQIVDPPANTNSAITNSSSILFIILLCLMLLY